MKLRFLLTLLGIFLVAGISAQDEHENRKNWSEGELTWNDFTEKTISVGTSQLNYVIGYKTKKEKSGDTTLFRFDTYCYVDKNLSWVHKESKNDQILYYNQVIFDLAELQRRKLQYELDRVRYNYDAEYKLNQSYSNLNSEVNKFQFESDYGQDISVINKWHILIDNELKTYKNPSIPKFMKRNVGFAVHTGFGVGVFSGSMGEHFRPTFNFIYGFDLAFKKTILYLNATLAWSKVTNDYHTNQIWLIGQQAHFAILDMSLGYAIIDKSKLKL